MNRSTWVAVLITVAVLAGAGAASRLSWRSGTVLVEQTQALVARALDGVRQAGAIAETARSAWDAAPREARLGGVAAVVLLMITALTIAQVRRSPYRRALQMLRRGGSLGAVGRRTGMARDAIRALARARRG